MSISETFANQHMKKWIDSWNNHDIKTVLSMYSENIEFSSPKIKIVFPDNNALKINNRKDLEEYWLKALSPADYYFIGLLSNENVNQIEPLTITPNPNSLLRVRFYYEALSTEEAAKRKATTLEPELNTPFERSGFSVVEWGGMVKQDKDHPFTCSI